MISLAKYSVKTMCKLILSLQLFIVLPKLVAIILFFQFLEYVMCCLFFSVNGHMSGVYQAIIPISSIFKMTLL